MDNYWNLEFYKKLTKFLLLFKITMLYHWKAKQMTNFSNWQSKKKFMSYLNNDTVLLNTKFLVSHGFFYRTKACIELGTQNAKYFPI